MKRIFLNFPVTGILYFAISFWLFSFNAYEYVQYSYIILELFCVFQSIIFKQRILFVWTMLCHHIPKTLKCISSMSSEILKMRLWYFK